MSLKQTPSQTVGPYFAYGLVPEQYGYAFRSLAGAIVPDALIEIWQADARGRYAHPADPRGSNAPFKGFGRCGTGTDPQNRFVFETIKPGSPDDRQAPHVNVIVFMRGLLLHAYTRIYFADEAAANARDPVLASVPPDRRATLLAERHATSRGVVYRFEIRMQGERETVFFDA